MRAVAYEIPLPIADASSLIDADLPEPADLRPHDLLVEVKAVSVNPVDMKIRSSVTPPAGTKKILGWDAAGIVRKVGPQATGFTVGDEVFYAGAIDRPGSNAELHAVDARIVAKKPRSLGFAAAAALPLTSITAWETLFDRLRIKDPVPGAAPAIFIIGGAGGVGSMAVQLARTLTDLTVIATASRPETQAWVTELGAHHVIDHGRPLAAQIAALGIGAPAFVFSTTNTEQHLAQIVELISPQGRFALIDDPKSLDINPMKRKSLSVHWELMFTRSLFNTADMAEQGKLLAEVARLIDGGTIRTTLAEHFGTINAQNLKRAHAAIETGRTKGKIVLEGF
ncbi:zinc-binding alcohol dehydrogenase family protein [Dongia sp.]|uniref:zinc-binding alcohol dehydrogenase family protein n=1 Tax=Dongia sp. TaxID=1977262 RepID=UPI0035B25CFE